MNCRYCQAEQLSDEQSACHNCGKPHRIAYEVIRSQSEIDALTQKPYKQTLNRIACGLALNGTLALSLLAIAPADPEYNQAFWELLYSTPTILIILSLMAVPFFLFPIDNKLQTKNPEPIYQGDEHPLAEAFKWRYDSYRNQTQETSPYRPPDFFYPPKQETKPDIQSDLITQNPPDNVVESGGTFLILYQDIDDNVTSRKITIKKIQQEGRAVYIKAYCHLRKENRTFRRDRIIGDITDTDTGEVLSPEILVPFKRKRKPR
jgi:hypothetical protein